MSGEKQRAAGNWRRPKSGGYQSLDARPEPSIPPQGRAGTSVAAVSGLPTKPEGGKE